MTGRKFFLTSELRKTENKDMDRKTKLVNDLAHGLSGLHLAELEPAISWENTELVLKVIRKMQLQLTELALEFKEEAVRVNAM